MMMMTTKLPILACAKQLETYSLVYRTENHELQELIMDEIPERDVTYHLTCLLIYHGTTTHLYSCFIFF